jgi:hypothetical protein
MTSPSCARSRYPLAHTFVPVRTGCGRQSRDQQETCSPRASHFHHALRLLRSRHIHISVPHRHPSLRLLQSLATPGMGCRFRLAFTLKVKGFPWPLSRRSRSVVGYDGIPPTRESLGLSTDSVKKCSYLLSCYIHRPVIDYLSTATPTDAPAGRAAPQLPSCCVRCCLQVANAFLAFSLAVYTSHSYYRTINFCIIAFTNRWSLNFLALSSYEKRLPGRKVTNSRRKSIISKVGLEIATRLEEQHLPPPPVP